MDISQLEKLARLIRYYILISTTQAGSGHATSALSAVELVITLFFKFLRTDIDHPDNPANDRFILSKGHASPFLYALYAAAGKVSEEELLKLRTLDSPLEGHPTMRFPYTEMPTGSLGQGLSVGVGEAIALRAKISNIKYQISNIPKIFVLLGDGELAEGQVWEAIQLAKYYKLNNLIALIDVNRLGQSQETMYGADPKAIAARIASFGWRTYVIENGHDFGLLDKAFSLALEQSETSDTPAAIILKTVKGKGVSFLEDKDGWHGRALTKEELEKALIELGDIDKNIRGSVQSPLSRGESGGFSSPAPKGPEPLSESEGSQDTRKSATDLSGSKNGMAVLETARLPALRYKSTDSIATRKAFGNALVRLAPAYPNMVVLDGDVQNSTYTELFAQQFPDRFFQMFIAEQNMVSAAVGMSKMGLIPVVATFGSFLTRAFDQLRMVALSGLHIVVCGSHAGVSIGQDGPSQMGLEDIALFRALPGSTVLYPSDAVSCERLVEQAVQAAGIVYIRTTRPATPVIYSPESTFTLGGSSVFYPTSTPQGTVLGSSYHVVRNENTQIPNTKSVIRATIIVAGITLHEALKAQKKLSEDGIPVRVIDCYSIKPIDEEALMKAADQSKAIIVVEDHYPQGGLGEAVESALTKTSRIPIIHLAVTKIPRSGSPQELMEFEKIDSSAIAESVRKVL